MQMQSPQGLTLADIPMGFFPEEVLTVPKSHSMAAPASAADAIKAEPAGAAPSRAVRLARAKTGESEIRLLAEQDGDSISYVLAKSTISPYVVKREPLVDSEDEKTPMNYQQAVKEFERRVASAYPSEKLRNNKMVATHLNLI